MAAHATRIGTRRLSHKNSIIRSSIHRNGQAFMGGEIWPFVNGQTSPLFVHSQMEFKDSRMAELNHSYRARPFPGMLKFSMGVKVQVFVNGPTFGVGAFAEKLKS